MNAIVTNTEHDTPVDVLVKREQEITASATVIENKPLRCAIAYNPYSLDSLLAAALVTYLPLYEGARTVPYSPFNPIESLLQYDRIFFAGVEIGQLDFTKLMTAEGIVVETTSYRDGYEWMTDKIRSIYTKGDNPRLVVHMPISDYYNELLSRTDNTAIKVVHFLLQQHDVVITNGCLIDKEVGIVNLASRMVSQSYPIMPFTVDLDQGVGDFETENTNKARLLDATNKLRVALAAACPRQEVRDLTITPDVDAYLAHFRQVRYAMNRSLVTRTYRMSTGVLSSKTLELPTVQASEMIHSDILHAALQNYNEVVTYEDIGNYRVYRIYAPTPKERRQLATIFKPVSIWSEGVVICVLTHLERQS